jgi:hypothetical protein
MLVGWEQPATESIFIMGQAPVYKKETRERKRERKGDGGIKV